MALGQDRRNRLQSFVNDARELLADEFTRQLQQDYGMDPEAGTVADLASLTHLDDSRLETAQLLRDIQAHYLGAAQSDAAKKTRQDVLLRIAREQAFTVLNRLVALRLMEARGLIQESMARGYQSKGFELYARLAGPALGDSSDAYRCFLFSVFDEFAQELPQLFDRYSPQGRLFPRDTALLDLLALINHQDLESLWAEDETIGWIYQYFNSKEERKEMRKSAAPRNSRELAVRNQFFTPRYVVEFLVDNSLGRAWFDWTGGQTELYDRCQYLLRKADDTPELSKALLRDPRSIKLLDPACGSMHFGLYAFDLFEVIYGEAWEWEQANGPGSLTGAENYSSLQETYADQGALLLDVPRLIIEHNIYGVDIDARATQIASLALWLRAQRSWHDAGIKAKDRPAVGQGHVIAAVAPPAEPELREQMAANLDANDAKLFEETLKLLKGLPELGVLLRTEQDVHHLIRSIYGDSGDLFIEEDMERWEQAESRLRDALEGFVKAAQATYQGRLFAQDALEGLRLMDLVRDTFDVVVMNPPFGASSLAVKPQYVRAYPESKADICASFVSRGLELLSTQGYVAAITSRAPFFLQSFEKWRQKEVLSGAPPTVFADLGLGVMDDALVEAAAYCLSPSLEGRDADIIFIRALDEPKNKDRVLRSSISPSSIAGCETRFEIRPSVIASLPRAPFAYWTGEQYRRLFADCPALESQGRQAKVGLQTSDDFRFLRLWWEIPSDGLHKEWELHAKGGEYSPFYADIHLVVRWANGGREIESFEKSYLRNTDFSYRPGLTWTHRTKSSLSFRVLPGRCTFGGKGPSLFVDEDDHEALLALVGLGLSKPFCDLVELQLAAGEPTDRGGVARSYDVGVLQRTPVPNNFASKKQRLAALAREGWELSRLIDSKDEVSHAFDMPRGFPSAGEQDAFDDYGSRLNEVRRLIDLEASELYELDAPDHHEYQTRIPVESIEQILSYVVGLVFKRFDICVATGERRASAALTPFDSLPTKSPGMLADGDPASHSGPTILVDDPGHECDLPRLMEESFQKVGMLAPDNCRRWLQRDFFKQHLSQYSKSRRKAPIYWPLSIGSANYTLWLYYPKLDDQTLYKVINDFLDPKLQTVENLLDVFRSKPHWSVAEERDFEKQHDLREELIDLRNAILEIAPNFKPNQNDGVQITAAPLWGLFRHKQWQRDLKETWEKLEVGEYDWAHLAYSYWPGRVREKCKTDKSLAIAHGLEELFEEPAA